MHPVFCFISYVFIVYMLKEKETGPWGDLRKKKNFRVGNKRGGRWWGDNRFALKLNVNKW
jgi:hypothetical protein